MSSPPPVPSTGSAVSFSDIKAAFNGRGDGTLSFYAGKHPLLLDRPAPLLTSMFHGVAALVPSFSFSDAQGTNARFDASTLTFRGAVGPAARAGSVSLSLPDCLENARYHGATTYSCSAPLPSPAVRFDGSTGRLSLDSVGGATTGSVTVTAVNQFGLSASAQISFDLKLAGAVLAHPDGRTLKRRSKDLLGLGSGVELQLEPLLGVKGDGAGCVGLREAGTASCMQPFSKKGGAVGLVSSSASPTGWDADAWDAWRFVPVNSANSAGSSDVVQCEIFFGDGGRHLGYDAGRDQVFLADAVLPAGGVAAQRIAWRVSNLPSSVLFPSSRYLSPFVFRPATAAPLQLPGDLVSSLVLDFGNNVAGSTASSVLLNPSRASATLDVAASSVVATVRQRQTIQDYYVGVTASNAYGSASLSNLIRETYPKLTVSHSSDGRVVKYDDASSSLKLGYGADLRLDVVFDDPSIGQPATEQGWVGLVRTGSSQWAWPWTSSSRGPFRFVPKDGSTTSGLYHIFLGPSVEQILYSSVDDRLSPGPPAASYAWKVDNLPSAMLLPGSKYLRPFRYRADAAAYAISGSEVLKVPLTDWVCGASSYSIDPNGGNPHGNASLAGSVLTIVGGGRGTTYSVNVLHTNAYGTTAAAVDVNEISTTITIAHGGSGSIVQYDGTMLRVNAPSSPARLNVLLLDALSSYNAATGWFGLTLSTDAAQVLQQQAASSAHPSWLSFVGGGWNGGSRPWRLVPRPSSSTQDDDYFIFYFNVNNEIVQLLFDPSWDSLVVGATDVSTLSWKVAGVPSSLLRSPYMDPLIIKRPFDSYTLPGQTTLTVELSSYICGATSYVLSSDPRGSARLQGSSLSVTGGNTDLSYDVRVKGSNQYGFREITLSVREVSAAPAGSTPAYPPPPVLKMAFPNQSIPSGHTVYINFDDHFSGFSLVQTQFTTASNSTVNGYGNITLNSPDYYGLTQYYVLVTATNTNSDGLSSQTGAGFMVY